MANTKETSNVETSPVGNEVITLTDGEMETLKEVMETYNQCAGAFGQVEVQKMNLNQQLEQIEEQRAAVEEEWKSNQTNEANFSRKLTNKYGPGSINPETGEYTPMPEQDQQAQAPQRAMA